MAPTEQTTPLKLISSMATRELLAELADGYARSTGRPVSCMAAGGVDVAKRVQSGEEVDVVVLSRTAIDKLMADERLAADSRVDLVKSGIFAAVKRGAPKPAIDNEAAVKNAVRAARSISFSTGPSGVYLEGLFNRWGILAGVRDRIIVPPPGRAVGSLIADGTVDLGFQQLSELLNLPEVEVVGPLPPDIQEITVFSGAILASSGAAADAARLLEYLGSPKTAAIKQKYGMEPA